MPYRLFVLFCVLNSVSLSAEHSACEAQKSSQTEVGERVSLGRSLTTDNNPFPIFHPDAKYLRALVRLVTDEPCNWALYVRDSAFRPVQVLRKADFADGLRWTERIAGDHLVLDLHGCVGTSPRFKIDSYVEMPLAAKNPYYSKQDDIPTWHDLYQSDIKDRNAEPVPSAVKQLGDNVAFLMMTHDRRSWVCSGVMLRAGVLLTNWHCGGIEPLGSDQYWRNDIVHDTIADISWDGDLVSREYEGVRLLAGDPSLDYALLQMRQLNGSGEVSPVTLSKSDIESNQRIYLIHHVEGMPKQLSECHVTAKVIKDTRYAKNVEFGHNCDSEKGSSGGALFDDHGELIGIHHAGFSLSSDCTQLDKENKAIRIKAIVEDIEHKDSTLYEKYLK